MLSVALLLGVVSLPVPFVPQEKDTCGAAALAMVLRYYGDEAAHDTIATALVEPELQGIRGSRLAEFARQRGMVALVFAGDLALAREHVGKGRPLVLSIAAGHGRFHDVVLVGFDGQDAAIVNDPALGPDRRLGLKQLEKAWRATGHWTLLVQPLEEAKIAPAASATDLVRPGLRAVPVPPPAEPRLQTPRVGGADAGTPPGSSATPPLALPDSSGGGDHACGKNPPRLSHPSALPDSSSAGDPGPATEYDSLVARAVALGRSEQTTEARALLDRAIRLDGRRAEAWVERGGLHFLAGRYGDAIRDLRQALSIREDAYARDLLASSLQLAGREIEALAAWNPLGKPALAEVHLSGLDRTRDPVARREVELETGQVVTPSSVRAARRRLEETGAFDRVTVRANPAGDGTADLDVALSERHGFARSPLDLALTSAVNLAWQRARLRYSNLGGTGIAIGASARWQENRPEAALQLQWPRPFGVPGNLRLTGFRGRQAYEIAGPFEMHRRGLDLAFRHVLDSGATVSMGVRARDRSFSAPVPDARPGLMLGLEAAIEARALETARQRLDLTLRAFGTARQIGSDVGFGQFEGELRYEAVLGRPEGRSVERSVLATRLRAGWGSEGMPIDEMYAPGVSPESDLPLRAHPLTRHGIIGANPLGRSILLLNAEWRQRLVHRPAFDVSAVAFGDLARVFEPAGGSAGRLLVDGGAGLRVAILGGPLLRFDYAWGLNDGRRRALFVGLGQAF